MPDTDAVYLKLVSKAAKSGLKSQLYIGSLIDLGMHYNRAGKSAQACATLTKALAIVDAGALQFGCICFVSCFSLYSQKWGVAWDFIVSLRIGKSAMKIQVSLDKRLIEKHRSFYMQLSKKY